ncbi:YqgE/AlgH family protein [uncultured Nocardioides sp.]|uniref:YqgE/AlgH family protein n=1 Tax=uncultured Nocardioides sp. TaxID=198441 RepID=UPI002630BEE4|nr:YqgE/AlgH family protein [uncultured Nocardioides sp.]
MSGASGGVTGGVGEVVPGTLLVASPELLDPNFADTVVLMIDVDDDGAVGLVLNRPSAVMVADVLAAWRDVVSPPETLFTGGPVGSDGALGLVRLADPDPGTAPVGFRALVDDLGLVDLDTPVELVEGSVSAVRIYAGYAGWGAEQLRGEIAEGSWYVVPGEVGDVFRPEVEDLRRDVLRRQPGERAWAATRPADPGLN